MYEILPTSSLVVSLLLTSTERNHLESLLQLTGLLVLLARTYVNTVTATKTVKNRRLDYEVHTLHCCRSLHLDSIACEASKFLVVKNEWADC